MKFKKIKLTKAERNIAEKMTKFLHGIDGMSELLKMKKEFVRKAAFSRLKKNK